MPSGYRTPRQSRYCQPLQPTRTSFVAAAALRNPQLRATLHEDAKALRAAL